MCEPKKDELAVTGQIVGRDLVAQDNSQMALFLDTARWNQMCRVAQMMSESNLIPNHFRGKPQDVVVALTMADGLSVHPMMLMQTTYPVNGRLGLEAKLAIGLANNSGVFKDRIQWEMTGEKGTLGRGAIARAHLAGVEPPHDLCEAECTMEIAKAYGWLVTKNKQGVNVSHWAKMPDMMLKYRSATFLVRLYCPEVLLGMQTNDELQDIQGFGPSKAPSVSLSERTKDANGEAEGPAIDIPPAVDAEPERGKEKPAGAEQPPLPAGESEVLALPPVWDSEKKTGALKGQDVISCLSHYTALIKAVDFDENVAMATLEQRSELALRSAFQGQIDARVNAGKAKPE